MGKRIAAALDPELAASMARHPDRSRAVRRDPPLGVVVEPLRARFSAWYELFPRSTGAAGRHGTLADAEARLPQLAEMGFDVVYLPPIHPIGQTHRKGREGALVAVPGDPGSPWAIGSLDGGHHDVHPELGTVADFVHFVEAARRLGLEVALDVAFQASPDHPWVAAHPEWFLHRADGSIQYAENPPKQYQDVYPFDFTGPGWRALWEELAQVFETWIGRGVRIFRVDNPHTKPLPFWHWCIARLKERHPDVIFLAEAFTRPRLMYALARRGFSQSYTYFTWRTSKVELTQYLEELCGGELSEYFRPNLWPNTPDILPEHLQVGGRPTFIARLVLAATLSASYGIYGPPFELMESVAREGAEEYARSEKYELRSWDLDRPDSLRPLIARLNRIRRENAALQDNASLRFHRTDNDLVVCYSKRSPDGANTVVVVVNLDPQHRHSAWVELDGAALGIAPAQTVQVHDLLGDGRYLWRGARNYVELDPAAMPAQIFLVRHLLRREQAFEYYL
jgi:starch synthase (maltosyl-transferring)